MNYVNIALFSVATIYVIFGFYVLVKRKADHIGGTFLVITLAIAAWNLSIALMDSGLVASKLGIMILDRVTILAFPVISMSTIFYLAALWGEDWRIKIRQNKIVITLGFLAVINVLLIPTNLISNNQGDSNIVVGPLWPLFGAYVLFACIYIIYQCYIGWKNGSDESRDKFLFVMLGYLLAAIGGIAFNIILPFLGYSGFTMYGALSTIFIVWFIGLGAVGTSIAGTVAGVISIIVAVVAFSLVVIGAAISLMFILIASLSSK